MTRMAVLRHLHGRLEEISHPVEQRAHEVKARRQDLGRALERRLSPNLWVLVDRIVGLARREKVRAYLVGGCARDLLLERETRDLDVVVEGDGPAFARALADDLQGRVRVHEAFLSAVVVTRDDQHINVGTARSEFYAAPAELPQVQMSAIRQDLYRRDFTINTLSIVLGPEDRLELLDDFGAQNDLQAGVIRVLHSLSFIDDPTRVLRAVRLEQRLGFRISDEAVRLAQVALEKGVFPRLSASRRRTELTLLLNDPGSAVKALERLRDLNLLVAIHHTLNLDSQAVKRMVTPSVCLQLVWPGGSRSIRRRAQLAGSARACGTSGGVERAELADRLALVGEHRRQVVDYPVRLRMQFESFPTRTCVPMRWRTFSGPSRVRRCFFSWVSSRSRGGPGFAGFSPSSRISSSASGAPTWWPAGITPGRHIGDALRATRDARLDGELESNGELEFARPLSGSLGGGMRLRKHWCTGAAVLGLILLMKGRAAYPLEGETVSLRSLELLRLDCSRDIGARDITLFGNARQGTLRPGARPQHAPRRVGSGILDRLPRRLTHRSLRGARAEAGSWRGLDRPVAWSQMACGYREGLRVPGARHSASGLPQVLAIVSELEESVGPAEESALPPGYVPSQATCCGGGTAPSSRSWTAPWTVMAWSSEVSTSP